MSNTCINVTWLRPTLAAYKLNSDKYFDPQPSVFAILTDLKDFYFFSYDGSTFKMDKEIHVSSATRAEFLNGMGDGELLFLILDNFSHCLPTVTERLFSTILEGYISILDAVVRRSSHQGTIRDVSMLLLPPNV